MANRAAGKGYENELYYENTKFHFLGIENIHTMRASLQKLIETCEQKSMNGFLSSLESSGWLKHIRCMLDTSCFIANAVYKGISVVVHCSDGWDRTSQVCSLAALMLDPFYRTIKGFQMLIEKDWMGFGHKFSERCGHLSTDPKEVSQSRGDNCPGPTCFPCPTKISHVLLKIFHVLLENFCPTSFFFSNFCPPPM